MEKEKFEAIVLNTLKSLPDKFKDKIKNLSIVIEEKDISPVIKGKKGTNTEYTLGLYQGLPATKRAGRMNILPDKITIYKKSLEEISRGDKELEKNIIKVILHELGHYFGLDEKKLRRLGY
jgi:predicted Zn-dependent protease with MMP-like domain